MFPETPTSYYHDYEMKPANAAAYEELKEEIEKEKKDEEERRSYVWFEDASNINFWEYRNINPTIIMWFEICMDIAQWDLLAAEFGLLYEEIQHCRKFHDGSPTRMIFSKLEDKEANKDLSLRKVLECLFKLNHHQILKTVPWQEGLEKLKNESNISKDSEHNVPSVNDWIRTTPHTEHDALIMLIYAHDARTEALKVVNQLRNPLSERGRIGVLLLDETSADSVGHQLRKDPCNSIHKWFKQVDYVVPVLSPQFLRQIQNRDWESNREKEKRYNRYVYRLTLDDYVCKESRNYKCLALCPSKYIKEIDKSELVMGNGLLNIKWNCSLEDKVEEFANILIKETQMKRSRQ
ncbi:uncharacterized protein [Panulirus ornatus]|uniref:uncharacterized protein isoform X2 n=1 Tax=Panulirus ornatus TaxID=150431 RepID=UPI003A84D3BA